jgi:hypothetical protein
MTRANTSLKIWVTSNSIIRAHLAMQVKIVVQQRKWLIKIEEILRRNGKKRLTIYKYVAISPEATIIIAPTLECHITRATLDLLRNYEF